MQLAKSDEYLKAVVMLHPSLVTVDDIKRIVWIIFCKPSMFYSFCGLAFQLCGHEQHLESYKWTTIPRIHSEVEVPIAILGGEIDKVTPPELVKQFKDAVKPDVRI